MTATPFSQTVSAPSWVKGSQGRNSGDEEEEEQVEEIEPPDEFAQYIEQARAQAAMAATQADSVARAKITIMIDSRIPNTHPPCLRRRLGQSLDLCFDTWVQWQASRSSPCHLISEVSSS